jgi:hypothetical protein
MESQELEQCCCSRGDAEEGDRQINPCIAKKRKDGAPLLWKLLLKTTPSRFGSVILNGLNGRSKRV